MWLMRLDRHKGQLVRLVRLAVRSAEGVRGRGLLFGGWFRGG
jgi:hypothetical protein